MPTSPLATAYRYLHEAINVIAEHAPDLGEVITRAHQAGWAYLCLDTHPDPDHPHPSPAPGPATTSGVPAHTPPSRRHHPQLLTDPSGFPVRGPLPGGTRFHPRHHHRPSPRVLPALYPAAKAGLPTLTDKGYTGAGIGILTPAKGHNLAIDDRARNQLINGLRAPAERGNALLKTTFAALRRVTVCPQRIGHIVAAALVLLTMNHKTW